jgi:hypothetical protein
MAIWGCGLPACCCQPAVAGGFIYADLRGELSTHLALQALFTQRSSGHDSYCYELSPFQAHWVRWHCTSFLRLACLFTAHVGSGSSPLSCGVFLPLPHLQAFPLLIAGCVPPFLPSLAWLVYLEFCEWSPPASLELRVPHPLCHMSLLLLLLITQFLFFSLCGGWSVEGPMLIWPTVVCGSTAYHLAHLVIHVFPSHLATSVWRRLGGPPGFSI